MFSYRHFVCGEEWQPRDMNSTGITYKTETSLITKELWVFWYGEEPDLTGLVSPDLTADSEQGSWESGLSYECRTLLFKALHNLIERNLMSRGFSRLGKWFVQPYDGSEKIVRSQQFSFSFNFLSMVKVQYVPAQMSDNEFQCAMILCPYGMAGALTGQSYKDTDLTTQRLLSEWSHFYPVRSKKETVPDDDHIMPAVEVIVGGIRMRYPSSYVLVTEVDETAAIGSNPNASHFHLLIIHLPTFVLPSRKLPYSQVFLLLLHLHVILLYQQIVLLGGTSSDAFGENLGYSAAYSTAWKIKEAVWQDSALQGKKQNPEGSDQSGIWDFSDPSSLVRCDCSRWVNV
ncbi:mediator of RNA polymerase II transcription subunit 13-like [Caerostris extrusa]|uniref:Mediator of RNA polymerase II transcription subunit 13 n=1 Tax=Caerostris extrusa TaxID=172846 RepID=A0AAV4Y9V2_CAEEX|nr:mediator of RNA polymerase II transcription subunit 13-like [Caerostris extrusa]